jgi:hypothetical protein
MGHEPVECWVTPGPVSVDGLAEAKLRLPSIEELKKCDLILATFLEHIQPWLTALYGIGA